MCPVVGFLHTHTYTQVDEVKNIMSDNIEKVLSRGEKLDLLVDKTDNLMFEVRLPGGHHLLG